MPDYSKGQIYKIVNNVNDKVYYGSTIEKLSNRMSRHRCSNNSCMSKNLDVNIRECKIILVENYPCNSKYELESRERYYIENFECVNKNIPTRTRKEYLEQNKDKIKQNKEEYYKKNKEEYIKKVKEYREKNKEKYIKQAKEYREKNINKIKEYQKEYRKKRYEENKEEYLKKAKEYRQKNKEEYLKKAKEYRQKNIDKLKQKVTCECGCIVSYQELARHIKTKKHQKHLNN